MGQVPVFTSYLLIGDGRVARHFARYFNLESIPYSTWTRGKGDERQLRSLAEHASHILLLISDGAIEPFFTSHSFLQTKVVVHASGALASPLLPSAHPLMTFPPIPIPPIQETSYDLETYRHIPFVLENGRGTMAELLPRLSNPAWSIESAHKTLYHALCVMSGNFTVLLWEKMFAEFERLELPKETALPYLDRIARNLATSPAGRTVLTGPLVRDDHAVMERHLSVLNGDPFEGVYRAFVHAYHRTHHCAHHSEKRNEV